MRRLVLLLLLALVLPTLAGTTVINSFVFSGGGGGGSLPLDSYSTNLLAAYSVPRRLLTSYTGNLIKIRRSSDDTTSDIGYNGSNELDTTAISTFVGSNSAYIHTIYDQSGNGYNLVMATNAAQMRIVNAGTNDTLASKPVAYNSAGFQSAGYATATFTAYTGTTLSCFARGLTGSNADYYARFVGLSKDAGVDYTPPSNAALILQSAGGGNWVTYRASDLGNTINTPATSDGLISAIADGTNLKLRDGTNTGTAASSASWDFNRILLGYQTATSSGIGSGAKFAEVVLWTSDQTSNEAAIRSALTY